jgi:hypothetical protein
MEKGYKKYAAVMILCFLFGGFSLILYLLMMYSVFWQNEMILGIRSEGEIFNVPVFANELRNTSGNFTPPPMNPERRFIISNPSSLIFSPFSLTFLIMGIISIIAGISLWNLIRDREIKFTKKAMMDVFLMPEEKKVLEEIEKYGGSLTQSELVKTTGLSRVKIHRVLRNLENKKIIIKQEYGMTNKIVLKK